MKGAHVQLEVSDMVPARWDELVEATPGGHSATATRRWLRLAPKRLPGSAVTFIHEGPGGNLIGIAGSVMEQPSLNSRIDPLSIFSGASAYQGLAVDGPHPWRDLGPGDVFPCLLLMFPHYELFAVGGGAGRDDTCRSLVRAILNWAEGEGMRSLAVEYMTPHSPALAGALREAGADLVRFADTCDLEVAWRDFDGYLGTLPARRRKEIRRELRTLSERKIEINVRRPGPDEPALIGLRGQLVSKYGSVPDPAKDSAMLRRVLQEFPLEQLTVVEALRDGRPLGFGLFVQEGSEWIPIMTGADYADPYSRLTYFASLFYKPCALAPELGVRTVRYGLGSWEAKRLRGCRMVPLSGAALLVRQERPADRSMASERAGVVRAGVP
jgi:hypothetical protein